MVKNLWFCSFTNNKLVNEAANDSARVSGQDRKKTAHSQAKKKVMLLLLQAYLAALHLNFNLHREDKVNKDGTVPLKVSYPKFKNGEATIRSRKIEQNLGK